MEGSEEASTEKKQSIKKKKKKRKEESSVGTDAGEKNALLGKHCISKMVFLC